MGFQALSANTTGGDNTATGFEALFSNTSGQFNTATGFGALASNSTGDNNTAAGLDALIHNTTGGNNTATGFDSLFNNTTGQNNTAEGSRALTSNTIGSNNIALGVNAGRNLTTGDNNIEIGHAGKAGESGTIRFGTQGTHKSTFIAGIYATAVTGSTVVVNSNGKVGVAASSARFKEQIRPMAKASEAILALRPVTFRYREELDPDKVAQFGLIAEEVEKVAPELVSRDEEGKPYTVRYEAVSAMLLNEFLKEHRKVAELASKLQAQQRESQAQLAQQQQRIEALGSRLQKVSDQLQAIQPTLVVGK